MHEPQKLLRHLVRVSARASLVQATQDAEGRHHRIVTRRLRREQVEPAAGGPEQEQIVVAEAEQRGM